MSRRSLFLFGAAVLAAAAMPALPAVAGGGCHAGATTGEGDTVEMEGACFTPTILQIDPGDTVTFVNLDPMIHNVGGNGWGDLSDLTEGEAFSATFDQAGTFPYACSYHPGMTGAIVVGSGRGAGNGAEVTVATYQPPDDPAATGLVAERTTPTVEDGSSPIGWIAAGAAGLIFGLGAGRFGRRRSGEGATSS